MYKNVSFRFFRGTTESSLTPVYSQALRRAEDIL
jgi:hypothetical protein